MNSRYREQMQALPRWRSVASTVLVALAVLLFVLSILGVASGSWGFWGFAVLVVVSLLIGPRSALFKAR